MKKLLTLLLLITCFQVSAQVYPTLPSGYTPYSAQIYRKIASGDTTFIFGAAGKSFVVLADMNAVKRVQDSIANKANRDMSNVANGGIDTSKVNGLFSGYVRNQKTVDQPGDIRIGGSISVGHDNSNESNELVLGDTIRSGAAFGRWNKNFSWDNLVAGTGNWADGKISGAYGNTNIASGNDSWAAGNRTVTGRKMYPVLSQGVDNPGLGIGNRAYVVISPVEGDITGYFPNATKDGDTSYIDSTYAPGYTIADGYVSNPDVPGDEWRMPPYMILRSAVQEIGITLKKILKADYNSATGTKIYYDTTASAYTNISYVYGSYAPIVLVRGVFQGNSMHTSGLFTQAVGYAASASGNLTRAWNIAAIAEGSGTWARGVASHSQGLDTRADAYGSFAGGRFNTGGGNPNSWISTDPLVQFGNGTSDGARSNAFELLKNGNMSISGTMTAPAFVGALTGTASGNLPLTGGTLTGGLNGTTSVMSGKVAWGTGTYEDGVSGIHNTASSGTVLVAKTGTSTDLVITNGIGSNVLTIPTGTTGIDVVGKVKASTLQLTSGSSNGYVLKVDGDGNVTPQPPNSSYKGTWNASTNTPTVADGVGATGDYYFINTSGTQFGRSFTTGGQAVYNGSIWEPISVAASVTSVAGKTGAVTLDKTDVGLTNVDNTSDATKNAATATLTNKTISGASNTFSNIPASAISSLATVATTAQYSDLLGKPTALSQFTNDVFATVAVTGQYSDLIGEPDISLYAPLASPTFTGTPTAPTPTAGDNSTKIATTAYVDGLVSSGTYTPTLTNGGNVLSTTAKATTYTRIGNIVSVDGNFDVAMSGGSTGTVSISLPVLSDFTGTNDANGIGSSVLGSLRGIADTANNLVIFSGSMHDGFVTFHFTYTIL